MHKFMKHLIKSVMFIVVFLLLSISANAEYVPDDNGEMHWWDAPSPTVLTPSSSVDVRINSTPIDAEVLFLMDTSGSMDDEFSALCSRITDIVKGLKDNNINIKHHIYGINSTRNCATEIFSRVVAKTTINHEEDWGPAAYDAALPGNYPWTSGYRKVVILMSDEGADNGDGWYQSDDDAIDKAITACKDNGVAVVPIIGTPGSTSQEPMILAGAQRLANACWGTVGRSIDPSATLVQAILNAINKTLSNDTSDKVSVQIHVDDAISQPINKIRGDIAFLVAQVTNGSGQNITGDLIIEYPQTWELVAQSSVVERTNDYGDETTLTGSSFTEEPGKITINGITTPAIMTSVRQYIVKVRIPEDENVNLYTVKATIQPDKQPYYTNPLPVPFKKQTPPGNDDDTNNCGQTSALMVICYYKGTTPTEQGIKDIDDWLHNKYGEQQAVNEYNGTVTNTTILETLVKEYGGFSNSYKDSGWGLTEIKNEIDNGYPIIAAVKASFLSNRGYNYADGHFVVVKGYTSTHIICNDPGTQSGNDKYYLNTEFANALSSQSGSVVVVVNNNITSASNQFGINIINETDTMIVTNRNLLYKNYGDTEMNKSNITSMLNNLHEIAKQRNGVVFYADWWDELIKNWTRDYRDYDIKNETELNAVVTKIDNYTHYWGKQLKGDNWQNEDIYLLLVGGDKEIPFYRKEIDSNDDGRPSLHLDNYKITKYLESAAKKNFIISDCIYKTTYGDILPENMFVGRLIAQDASNLLKFTVNILSDINSNNTSNNASLITDNSFHETLFSPVLLNIKSEYKTFLFDSEDSIAKKASDAMSINPDYFLYHGHSSFNLAEPDKWPEFKNSNPNIVVAGCMFGLSDWDNNELNESTSIFTLIRKNSSNIIASTTFQNVMSAAKFIYEYTSATTGCRLLSSNTEPVAIGKALNKAINNSWNYSTAPVYAATGFLLYGPPWKKIIPPSKRRSSLATDSHFKSVFNNPNTISSIVRGKDKTILTKTIAETISQYQIGKLDIFDQVEIENYNQLMEGILTTPVVPVRTIKVVLPDDAAVTAVNLTRADAIPLGVLNLPAFHDFAPIEGVDAPDVFQTAPDSIGLFNTTHRWFEIDEGKYKTVVIDVFPVSYDVVSDEATLYKNLTVEVEYNTQTKGVQVSSGPEKRNYTIGENIDVSTVVSNITDQDQNYTITTNLVSALNGTVVDTDTQSLNVPAGEEGETTLSLTPSLKGGGYWVKVAGKDNAGNSIGDTTEHIKASAGSITNFKVSEVIPDNNAVFEVTFSNQNAQTTNAQFGVAIYKGTLQVADFVPVAYDMASGTEQTAVFTWKVPTDFQFGQYMAVATIRAGDDTISASQNFEVGQLGGLTHLILTDKSAPMNIPSFANIIVTGSYQANTIKIATGAQVEFQNFVGANVLIFEESSSQFTAYRSGAMLYLTSSNETKIQIAAKTTLQSFYFADGKSDFVITNGKVMLGNQEITTTSTAVTSPGNNEQAPNTQITTLPESVNTYLLLTDTSIPLSIPKGAYIRVTGSSGANTINVESGGRAALENFVGSNIVNIQDVSTGFKIYHSGATVYLNNTSTGTMIIISAKSTAQIFRFANGSSNLFISNNKIMIGGQEVTTNEAQLVNPTNTGDTSEGIF